MVDATEAAATTTTGEHEVAAFRPYNEPDVYPSANSTSVVGQLTNPVASTSFYYQLNPNNKMKIAVDSARRVKSTYSYSLTNNIQFIASFNALFPAFDATSMSSLSAAGAGVKTSLGLSINIGAE
jgi:hypothetical protein